MQGPATPLLAYGLCRILHLYGTLEAKRLDSLRALPIKACTFMAQWPSAPSNICRMLVARRHILLALNILKNSTEETPFEFLHQTRNSVGNLVRAFHFQQIERLLTLFSELVFHVSLAVLHELSVSYKYLALGGLYHPFRVAVSFCQHLDTPVLR
jgi:hypothetical protein